MEAIYDLHITVNPDTFDKFVIREPWQIHDIRNVQGAPHLIISQKYIGESPHNELENIAQELERFGAEILRKKIELHFNEYHDIQNVQTDIGIIEIHYKYRKPGVFGVTKEQIDELNKKKVALSFNVSKMRPIISVRFQNKEMYLVGKADKRLPEYLEQEELEIVIFDSNNQLDSFWPMRTTADEKLSFDLFPKWATL